MNIEKLRTDKFWVIVIILITGPIGYILLLNEEYRKQRYISFTLIVWLLLLVLSISNEIKLLSLRFLTAIDNIFYMTNYINSIFAWTIIGILVGLVFGSCTAWKKYNLSFKVALIPIIITVLLISILIVLNKNRLSDNWTPISNETKSTELAYQYVTTTTSSQLQLKNGIYCGSNNLLDTDYKTAWIGVSNNKTGINEEVNFHFNFSKPEEIKKIEIIGFNIVNGYCKSKKVWNNHNRAATISIFHNGTYLTIKSIPNLYNKESHIEMPAQEIEPNDKITFKITSAIKGSKYINQTAISELIPILNIYR
ncbi:MAG: hypothetical protein IPK03_05520 [Bacteroidetes bacterium]|nr:hypothetical protein [Bacteroidota bacterium]